LFGKPGKTTGIRVQELVNVKMEDIDFDRCQIRINQGIGSKDRIVPFPCDFREILILFVNAEQVNGAVYLFESNRKKPFTTRGIRKIHSRLCHGGGNTTIYIAT
jgi:integrase/recombinase XerD